MNIDKAIRKQDKSHKRFLLFLSFIFFVLPLALVISGRFDIFFLVYLFLIESLVLIAVLVTINSNYLSYNMEKYKLKIKLRRFGDEISIACDKVIFVHVEGEGSDINIILITSSKFRSKNIRVIDESLMKKYPYLAHQYYRIKKHYPENNYFYITINKGGFHKYRLLDLIYRNCLLAQYSEEAINKIKEYRN
ncbi:hypothetical protein M2651_01690 [Clostridium sp. SYSU_GA19001]|uniref:hypothetical protein n=1 Tax=Clostridium caldaquaticum TaxID=2940653 RepID=UPI0020777B3F|nr:hypothetical protein [Clostridium caldaquaticum]MCM8709733.1 hypothetical protein [Clostridium caldaquaticum]